MLSKQKTYETLICLTLICFGFFGSLSHIFSLSLIILSFASFRMSNGVNEIDFNSKLVFLALSGCFFLFCITSIFRSNFSLLLNSLGPILPIPLIGILILFHNCSGFKLSSKKVAKFSQSAVFLSLVVYLLLLIIPDPNNIYYKYHEDRLTLFSGNPIPFSFCMLGISILCLADWKQSNKKNKLIAFLLFLIGSYFAVYLSGTRGTLLVLLFISPIVVFYLSNKLKSVFLVISTFSLAGLLIFQIGLESNIENSYFNRIKNGIETITILKNSDDSIWLRLDMWSAGIKAVFDAPLLGYGIEERFNALKPYLKNPNINFTHPHNDIIAGSISSGVLGGIASFFSLISSFLASLLTPHWNIEKIKLGLMLSCSAVITANVSTVFFNDISSAWLAFSTYLIWIMNDEQK